jgi:hypothetical protein
VPFELSGDALQLASNGRPARMAFKLGAGPAGMPERDDEESRLAALALDNDGAIGFGLLQKLSGREPAHF